MLRCQCNQGLTILKEEKIQTEKGQRRQGLRFLGNHTRTLQFLHQLAVTKEALSWVPPEDQQGGVPLLLDIDTKY